MGILAAPRLDTTRAADAIRVMVVDDAVVPRGMMVRWISAEPDLKIVAALHNGREAIEHLERTAPDVVLLDVDMPEIDGITALPQLLEMRRDLVVLMVSTLIRRNAEVSLRALALGALDYLTKPETNLDLTGSLTFRRDLIDKIRALCSGQRRRLGWSAGGKTAPVPTISRHRPPISRPSPSIVPDAVEADPGLDRALRPFSRVAPRALVIGSSTGGPQAVNTVIGALGPVIDLAPVLITQHMPPTFTAIFADHLARANDLCVREAEQGEPVYPGRVYVAPGGRHMRVVRSGADTRIVLDDGHLINFCKPAVDPLFSSAAAVWGPAPLALVLTGMGSDGLQGAADVVAAGGSVIAQDRESSVVWGMPGSVAKAGLCSAILPIDQLAARIARLFSGGWS
jgi:two-component system chemotaxis response regulator CheB